MTITEALETILGARYGREVRQAIHDGIKQAYEDAIANGNANMEVSQARGAYNTLAERLNEADDKQHQTTAQLAQKVNKGEVSVADINKNLGKFDQTYMTDEFLQQMAGTTPINAVPADGSLTTSKYAKESITPEKVSFYDEVALLVVNAVADGDFSKDSDGDGFADGWFIDGTNFTNPVLNSKIQSWVPSGTGYSSTLMTQRANTPDFLKTHKYYISLKQSNIGIVQLEPSQQLIFRTYDTDGRLSTIFTPQENDTVRLSFAPRKAGVKSELSKVIVVDLTKVFGAGNEPDAVKFEAMISKYLNDDWFSVINLADASLNTIVTDDDLKVYDPTDKMPGSTVNEVLKTLNDGFVQAVPGKNLYNPDKNIYGTIKDGPYVFPGDSQIIDTIKNPSDLQSQIIEIDNTSDLTMSGVLVYSVTDLQNRVIVIRTNTSSKNVTLRQSDLPKRYLLYVSVRPNLVQSAQVEMNSSATAYEAYTPVKSVYAHGIKLFDFPFEGNIGGDKKKEIYELAQAQLEINSLVEMSGFLKENAKSSEIAVNKPIIDSQIINLSNSDEKKLILHLHKRENDGFDTNNDVYLPNANSDFSDIKITNQNGEVLPYRMLYQATDIDVIADSRIGRGGDTRSSFLENSEGTIFSTILGDLSVSHDRGRTWSRILTDGNYRYAEVNLITADDTLIFCYRNKVYRSPKPYTSATVTVDLSLNYPDSQVRPKSMVQHPDGEIIFGIYQGEWLIKFYRSLDDGASWHVVADLGASYQHVHAMYIDTFQVPPAIYAGVDGGGGVLKSVDKGETWSDLRVENPNMPQSTDFGVRYADPSGYRLLTGETSIVGGHSIVKTSDDINFKPVLSAIAGVNYIGRLGGSLYATGAGTGPWRAGALYRSEDDGETWVGVYHTGALTDSSGANDGLRNMLVLDDEIIVGTQSTTRPALRILNSGAYAEIIVDVPEGSTAITVETGGYYPNILPISNNSELNLDKIIDFPLNENSSVVKELVSEELYQSDVEWTAGGQRLFHFYPEIIGKEKAHSAKMNTLKGFQVTLDPMDLSDGVTISFWAKLSKGTRFTLLENASGDKLDIVNGYQLHFNTTNLNSFGHPILQDNFIKYDIAINASGGVVYQNGNPRTSQVVRGDLVIDMLETGGVFTVLKNVSSAETDAIQGFKISRGEISHEQALKGFGSGVSDNYAE